MTKVHATVSLGKIWFTKSTLFWGFGYRNVRDLLQNEIENSYLKVITKCARSLLQNASDITKYVRYYKVWQLLQSETQQSYKQQISLHEIDVANIGLKEMKRKSSYKLIVGHLNINSIRNKFEFLEDVINRNLDIILLLETKLDDSFPSVQFKRCYI